jgi:hypothetical protein
MSRQWANNRFARLRRLIPVGVLLLSFTCGDVVSQSLSFRTPAVAASPSIASTVSTPAASHPNSDGKQSNPVRRFFSWVGQQITRPFRRRTQIVCSLPPTVTIHTSDSSITRPCPGAQPAISSLNCPTGSQVTLVANAPSVDDKLSYTWAVSGGLIRGEGRMVTWDLTEVPLGSYTATVEVSDGNHHTAATTANVAVLRCKDGERPPAKCPVISVSCPSDLEENKPITFEATVAGGEPDMKTTINWSLTAGKIISGQGTSKITVSASETERQLLTATATLDGADPSCQTIASCTIKIETVQRRN